MMNNKEYITREKEIIKKINQVNQILKEKNVKVEYSMYNQNSIGKILEKNDIYSSNILSGIFVRNHTCDAKYMIDDVVNSYNIKNKISIEENFNIKISDLEDASVEELAQFFGNMDNHEIIGFGKNKKYQLCYRGKNNQNEDIEIIAAYGNEKKYKARTIVTKIGLNGAIEKSYTEDLISNTIQKEYVTGIEIKTPEIYTVFENTKIDNVERKYTIRSLGNENTNYQVVSKNKDFSTINSVNFETKYSSFSENDGKVENAKGKLVCRINPETGRIVKPDFSGVKNLAVAALKSEEFYNKYKNYPTIKVDSKTGNFIVEGEPTEIIDINLDRVLKNAKNSFNTNNNGVIFLQSNNSRKIY